MVRTPVWQSSFNAGELSPLVLGQFELAKYKNGCKQLINADPLIQGPVRKRKGSYFANASRNNTANFWLLEFIYDRFDAYVLEAGPNYLRFYRDRAQVTSGGSPYTLATPWANLTDTDGTFLLRIVQLNDVIYVCTKDNSVPPYELSRIADNNWTLTPYTAVGGPFQDENVSATTVWASGQTGTVTLTASASMFTSAHVGMLLRLAPRTLEYIGSWTPSAQQFLGTRLRSNGYTYTATYPTPVGTPYTYPGSTTTTILPSGPAYSALDHAIAVDVANGNTAPYLAAVETAFSYVGGTPANYAAVGTALNIAVAAGGTPAAIATAQATILGLLPVWGGAGTGLYTGTVQPSHDDGVVYDGSNGACANPYGGSPASVPCGVPWQFEDPGYGIVKITAITSPTVAVGTVQPFRAGLTSTPQLPYYVTSPVFYTSKWSWGAWGAGAGANNPTNVAFFRGRLCLSAKNGFYASVPQSFGEFYEETGGLVLSDNAIATTIEEQGAIVDWMLPLASLCIGAAGGEFQCSEQNISTPFGPTNIKISPNTNYGSHGSMPVRLGNALFFVDATGVVLRKLENSQQAAWAGQSNSPSQVDLAEHILRPSALQLKYAPLPFPAIIIPRTDGVIARYAYDKDEEMLAWSRYILGGYLDAAHNEAAKVLCAATVPSPDGSSTDIYLGVQRMVNGAISNTIEIIRGDNTAAPKRGRGEMKDRWLRLLNDWQCSQFHVDCGLTYDAPVAITSIVGTAGVYTVHATAHGFSNGDSVRFDGITSAWTLNARKFKISNVTASTFDIAVTGPDLPALEGAAPVARKYVTLISGLTHLAGETVSVCVDGAAHVPCVVSGAGSITLRYGGTRVHVGEALPMFLDILVPPAPGKFGHTEGTTQTIDHVLIRFDNTLGGALGMDQDSVRPLNFRQVQDPLGLAPVAFTGMKLLEVDEEWSRERSLVFSHTDPLPCTVCAMGYIIDAEEDVAP